MNGEIYMGGYRCIMCDWNDEVQQDYSAFGWIVSLIHAFVHSVSAVFALR